MRTLEWITNIPTPYRNHRYEVMYQVFPDYDIMFEILYMAWSELHRTWNFSSNDLHHPSGVWPGVSARVSGVNLHFNPGLLAHLRRSAPDIVVIGGFSAPTLLAAPFLCPRSTIRLLGVESNVASATFNRGPVHHLKRAMVRRYDGFVVPGEASREYIESLDSTASTKPFITLPNLVDRSSFPGRTSPQATVEKRRRSHGIGRGDQLCPCVARSEPVKGLAEFLPQLRDLQGVRLVIACQGSQRPLLERLIRSQDLPVQLVRHLKAEILSGLYKATDLFVLPNLQDPSPLAAVEAAASGLPLMLSRHVGNARDIVVDTDNGWIIDTADRAGTRVVMESVAAMTQADLRQRGRKSLVLYNTRFDSESAVRHMATELATLIAKRKATK